MSSILPIAGLASFGANNLTCFLLLYAAISYAERAEISYEEYGRVIKLVILLVVIFAVSSIVMLDVLAARIPAAGKYSCYYLRGNYRPVSLILSICIFLWAQTWTLQSRVINILGGMTFGVYLIHMYPSVMNWMFGSVFVIFGIIDKWYAVPWLLGSTILIFLALSSIECVRKGLFQLINKSKRMLGRQES